MAFFLHSCRRILLQDTRLSLLKCYCYIVRYCEADASSYELGLIWKFYCRFCPITTQPLVLLQVMSIDFMEKRRPEY